MFCITVDIAVWICCSSTSVCCVFSCKWENGLFFTV